MLALTRNVFATLAARGLEPVAGQRGVCSERHRIGTAIDILCYDTANHHLVVCELKCGHNGSRAAAAQLDGVAQKMHGPLSKGADNTINRHLAQLAVHAPPLCAREEDAPETGQPGHRGHERHLDLRQRRGRRRVPAGGVVDSKGAQSVGRNAVAGVCVRE